MTRRGDRRHLRAVIGSEAEGGGVPDDLCCLGLQDGAADDFRDLRDNGVAEGSKAVHPRGNPMSHSTHVGFSEPPIWFANRPETWSVSFGRMPPGVGSLSAKFTARPSSFPEGPLLRPSWLKPCGVGHSPCRAIAPKVGLSAAPELAERLKKLPLSTVTGVGNNPNPVPLVRRTNGGSWNAVPFRIKPERGQVPENAVEPSPAKRADVLHDDVEGSKLANKTGVLEPETRSLARKPRALPRDADVLAGEAATDDIDGDAVSNKSVCREGPHIVIARDAGPVLCENGAAVGLDFAEGDGSESFGPFEPKAETSNAAEQVEHFHRWVPVGALARRIVRQLAEMVALGGEDAGK